MDLYFLERAETASSRLHVQRALDVVPHAFVLILAVSNGSKLLSGNLLESLRTANITGVGVDQQKWLDLRHPGDDAANGNELSEVHAFDFAYGHRNVGE